MPEPITADLIAEGRALLAASSATADLLPLGIDRVPFAHLPDALGWLVCDRNGLEWAQSRHTDRSTVALIAYAVNHLAALLDAAERESAAVALLEYALHLRVCGERAPGGNETWHQFDLRTEAFLRRRIDEPSNPVLPEESL